MGIKIPPLLFYAFLIALRPAAMQSLVQIPGSMPSPRPLCASQFTLVNYACSTLPLAPLPGTSPVDDLPFDPFPDSDYELPESDHDHHQHHQQHHHNHHNHNSESGHHHGHGHEHSPVHHGHHHENRDHHSRHRSGHRQEHEHRHGQDHKHRGHHHSQEDECCRWLQQVDPQCVCNVLVHLPTFLSRPNHVYTAVVGDSCNVTFACGGRFRP